MNQELLMSIRRHWTWANWIKKQLAKELEAFEIDKFELEHWFINPPGVYMSVWYGLLFAVCEGLKDGGSAVPEAQKEIDELYESLHLFRNATFHVQRRYWSNKLLGIMKNKGSATKIHHIHEAIGKWLLAQLPVREAPPQAT